MVKNVNLKQAKLLRFYKSVFSISHILRVRVSRSYIIFTLFLIGGSVPLNLPLKAYISILDYFKLMSKPVYFLTSLDHNWSPFTLTL